MWHFYHHQHHLQHTWLCDRLNYLSNCNIITLTFATVQLISSRYHLSASLICCLPWCTWIRCNSRQTGSEAPTKYSRKSHHWKHCRLDVHGVLQMQHLPGLKSIEKWHRIWEKVLSCSCSPLFTYRNGVTNGVSLSPLSCSSRMQMMIKWKREGETDKASV